MQQKKWFESWFDSPYYHILYKHRDHSDAALFIDNLIGFLKPIPAVRFLDMACGNGRHTHYIAKKGYQAVGFDLSPQNIFRAEKNANEKTSFYVHDMRNSFPEKGFDYILNLFTSFGYFEDKNTHLKVLKHVRDALAESGIFVMDFFNAEKIINDLKPEEVKSINGIDFHIKKYVQEGKIIKEIRFEDQGNTYKFHESVFAFTHTQLTDLLEEAGFQTYCTFGDYNLQEFDAEISPRCIVLSIKR